MCAVHSTIHEDLQELVYKCCASMLVTPHKKIGLPKLEWWRFSHITIKIDHYEDHSRRKRWAGVKEVVRRLREAEILPEFTILFHEISDVWSADEKWI